jgi:hypothetical protein
MTCAVRWVLVFVLAACAVLGTATVLGAAAAVGAAAVPAQASAWQPVPSAQARPGDHADRCVLRGDVFPRPAGAGRSSRHPARSPVAVLSGLGDESLHGAAAVGVVPAGRAVSSRGARHGKDLCVIAGV